jgi:uncharacterized membrane protein
VRILATNLVAATHGGGMHMALLGVVVIIGLIVFAIVWMRRKREAAEAEKLDQLDQPPTGTERGRSEQQEGSSIGSRRR